MEGFMNIPFKKDPEEYRQGMLFPGNLFDLLDYEIPKDLQYKEKRLKKIKTAKEALEKREQELRPEKST